MTQEELAGKSGVTNDTISRHERRPGDNEAPTEPSNTTKQKLARALGIRPEDFYRSPTDSTAVPEAPSLRDIMDQLMSVYGSGVYSKDEIEKEVLKFWLEIKSGEKD